MISDKKKDKFFGGRAEQGDPLELAYEMSFLWRTSFRELFMLDGRTTAANRAFAHRCVKVSRPSGRARLYHRGGSDALADLA